ncbi:hypothetical protein KEM48_002349 [Puccinia striiformis f. sp. tritici PST-130]|nr:hypothetical protein KEM48_002349 [Puccinia striiformis f. sp. tritici PST-130]
MMSDLRHRTTTTGKQERKRSPEANRSKVVVQHSSTRLRLILILLTVGCLLIYYFRSASSPKTIRRDVNFTGDDDDEHAINTFNRYPLPDSPWESGPRSAIKEAIKNSWRAYADSPAWGSDEFHPISRTGSNLTKAGSIGFMIVDALDTILMTGEEMKEDYERARSYVEKDLTFEVDGFLNAFETTIRILGGLLSVYHLSGNDTLYLDKAVELGTRLLPIFDTPTGIPYSFINLKTGQTKADSDNRGFSSLAEATTIQLEFKYLAELTQKRVFWDVAERAMNVFKHADSHNGLLPILVSPQDGSFFFDIRLGSRGDSYYEYLIKQYLQTNRTQMIYKEMYDTAMTGVKEELVRMTPGGLVYVGELHPSRSSYKFVPKQDHLVCFLGGLLMLGVTEGERALLSMNEVLKLSESAQEDWLLGKELIKTCVNTYELSTTGLGPEIVQFINRPDQFDKIYQRGWLIPHSDPKSPPLDARNILRPETVESLFFGWRTTKDPIYREWGWQIFQALMSTVKLMTLVHSFRLKMWIEYLLKKRTEWKLFGLLAETLKYLLLLFSDDSVIPLSSYVFNTEAHIFPIFTPTFKSDEDG